MSNVELGLPALPDKPYPVEVHARLAEDAKELIGRYPVARSALPPLPHLVQAEEGLAIIDTSN